MSKAAMVRARIESYVKGKAEAIFAEIGINPSTAIGMFYRRVIEHQGIPLSMRVYNQTTLDALEEAREGRNLTPISSLRDILEEPDDEGLADDQPFQEGLPPRE